MIDRPPRDIRVITIGDKAVTAMYRKSSDRFKTNIALGAEPEICDITNEIEAVSYTHLTLPTKA